MAEHARSGNKKKERVVPMEIITSVPSRQEAAPVRKAKPVTQIPKPARPGPVPVVCATLPVRRGQGEKEVRVQLARYAFACGALTPIKKYPPVSPMPPLVPEGLERTPLVGRTPRTQKYEEQCAQNLGDRLIALEERMSESKKAAKRAAWYRRSLSPGSMK